MGSPGNETDEPLTPAGRLFLRPEINQVIYCAMGFKYPIDVEFLKSQVRSSVMLTHPRFCSLMVRDPTGRERWRRTHIDLDSHFIVLDRPVSTQDDDESAVSQYLADLSTSSGLSYDKPLWEIHLLLAHKCAIFRAHHALGDGVSLMSMLLACCRREDDAYALPRIGSLGGRRNSEGGNRRGWWQWVKVLWGFLMMACFTLVFVVEFGLKGLWLRDRETAISGGAGVELWPRMLATASFRLEDMKVVKKAVPSATINDVLFGVISSGLSRYLDHRRPNALREGLRLTGVAMVNLREQSGLQDLSDLMKDKSGSRWGNKFGMILLPVYYHKSGSDPLQYLKRAKAMIDQKKQSLEAHFSYKIGYFVMSYLGSKAAGFLNYRIICNTSFTISNVVGPQEKLTVGTNPITYMRVNSSSLPHALTMHMVSYAGRADMQILVAKNIIPDPEFLAECFEEALLGMKEAAVAMNKI
ncbi:wax ester synthase/diacylglycerol acyltransferase 11-like [Alnus glutinosa]|uniref:wax ester synthase/diacylglycerol acyltransferase 11-like n=1 Tax=Alnus glutinosa TaxID=3517 RepID=UPI002D786BD7|nr:wax ester synthase/diacylglycerol acyltransferase 11-like [Alnus glutinosa]